MKALIVDDSATMRRIIASHLNDLKVETIEAEDGFDAYNKIKVETDLDFAFVDWDMPKMNGIEFLRLMRANSKYDDVKVMMITSHSSMSDIGVALKEGANDFLMKPFDAEMIRSKFELFGIYSNN